MNQQFPNSPLEKCDTQIYLVQGRFSNVPHQHKGHNISSAVTLTNLEEAKKLRMLQSRFCPGPQVSSSNTCAYSKQPVNTLRLKCPIIKMTNPFQRQTDRGKTGADVTEEDDTTRDMSYSQNIALDRSFLGVSEQADTYPDNHHHVQAVNAVHGFPNDNVSQVTTYMASQNHPMSSSLNQLCEIPQSRLCECTDGCDNTTQIIECDSLNEATPAQIWDRHFQWQANNISHYPSDVVFPCEQQSGHAGTNHYTCTHTEHPHNLNQHPHNHNQPSHNHKQPLHNYNQTPHNHNQPSHNHNQPSHNHNQTPHNHNQRLNNYNQPSHNHNQPSHNHNQTPHNHSQRLNNYNQPSHNHNQNPHNHKQTSHNHNQNPHNHNQPPHNYTEHPHNYTEHPHNYTEHPHNVDFIHYDRIQHDGQHPRMTGDRIINDPCSLALNSPTHPNVISEPMCARMTSHYRQHTHTTERHCHTNSYSQHPQTTEGHCHTNSYSQHPQTTEGQCHTNRAAFKVSNMSQTCPRAGAYPGYHQLPEAHGGYRQSNADIRQGERLYIRSQLVPGQIQQIHGAPMTGKSTLVRQAVSDANSSSTQPGRLCEHHINCKGIQRFQDFLSLVAQNWAPQPLRCLQSDAVINMIGLFLQENPDSHHVLVFHKCENLRENPHGQHFLEFLTLIVNKLTTLSISIVFTTYKYYWTPPRMFIGEVEVDVLSVIDIIKLLQYYVPHLDDCVSYANVLAKTFCFPEAVRLIAEEYLVVRNQQVTPDRLEKIINKNVDLLSQLFENRLPEVDTWVSKNDLCFLTHFKNSIENSFTEAHLEYVNSSDLDEVHLQQTISYLKQNHLVRSLPAIRRLVIHPLIVYHSMVSSSRDRQLLPERWLDNTRNRYIHFLGRVLMSIEANMHEHGRKGLVFAGLIQEWPNVQYVFQMALHCNRNTYGNFIKVAITASNYILKIFPREAESFYWSLYNSAKDYGTPVELAVMEAFLGQAVAEGTGKDWTRADQYLTSAIERLSAFGNSYFLGWAIIRKGIIHHRQGKYEDSDEYFQQASNVLRNVNRWALGEQFVVPEQKVDEEIITQRIHRTIPIIFTGRNKVARRCLNRILDLIQNSFENHPDIATLLNLIGLTEQRGNRNTERALLWYKLSYNERMYWAKACPESLLAVLNNIGMIYFYKGDCEESMRYLEKALAIRRECGWTHYNTALTLIHVAEINLKMGNLVQAYKLSLEAERIFAATVKDHDVRLRANLTLAHIRVLIRQVLEPGDAASKLPTRMQSQDNCGQDERPGEARGTQEGHNGAEENTADASHGTGQAPWDTTEDSVTSSQLFETDSGSQGAVNTMHHHHHHRQHSDNDSLPFPNREDILRISAAEIEPCDLMMSGDDYFEKILAIARSIHGTLSDDGLSYVLCAYWHLMLGNLENSPEKFEEFRTALAAFSEDNPWLVVDGDTDTGVESRYRCLIKHKPLYNYVQRTPYECLDIRIFTQYMKTACLTCTFIDNAFRGDTLETEAVHCIQKREFRKRWMQELDTRRSNTQHSSAGNDSTYSTDVGNKVTCNTVVFQELKQNCISTNLINARNVSSMKSETLLHQMIALPEELLSPAQDDGSMMELHHPIASDQCEAHRPTLKRILNQQSVMSPRIIKTQEEIMKRIQKDLCSLAASKTVDKSLPDGSCSCRKTWDDRQSMAVSGFVTSREPVEQSYHGNQDPVWSSDGSQLHQSEATFFRQASTCSDIHNHTLKPIRGSQAGTENLNQRKGHMHNESCIPCRQTSKGIRCNSRQICADTDNRNIVTDHQNIVTDHRNNVTDHVGDKVLPGLSSSQLVLEKCRSGKTSQSDPTSRQSGDLHFSTSEHKFGQDSSENKTGKTCENEKFSVLDYYIRNGLNINVPTNAEPAASISRNQSQHPAQQLPSEELHVTLVQDEKADGREVALQVSSSSSLGSIATLPSRSPSSQLLDVAPCSENYLRPHTASAGKHGQQFVTERQLQSHHPQSLQKLQPRSLQPQRLHQQSLHQTSLQPQNLHLQNFKKLPPQSLHQQSLQPHIQCVGSTVSPDDSQDSGLHSALAHNMNEMEHPNREASSCESSAFPRARSSSTLSSSSRRAYSHGTSNSESGYISEQHPPGMSQTRPVESAICSAGYHQNYFPDSHMNQAFSDFPFDTSHSLPTDVGCTNAVTEAITSGRMRTRTDLLATLNYMMAQMHNFPDQSELFKTDRLQQPSQEEQQPPQPEEELQIDNQATESFLSVLPENPTSHTSLRDPVEQSWNETLVPNLTQISAEVSDMSGCGIRQELLLLGSQIRQREYEISADSEEITLAENVRSSQS